MALVTWLRRDSGLVMYLVSVFAIVSAWLLLIRLDHERWRIVTGRMGLLLGVVTLGFQFFIFRH
jgi:hypothetical protein